ncbi:MAG: hypothetical protein DHS20C14_07850 [Phycisphaeraceae bacterium]|nr:MAG: hypothetical protein DHS20C14_07850 [Phycisphaeraceae bacterium]
MQLEWILTNGGGVCVITDAIGGIVAGGSFPSNSEGLEDLVLSPGLYVFRVHADDTEGTFGPYAHIRWTNSNQYTADCDGNGSLNIDDIDCFVSGFLSSNLSDADCTEDGVLNIDDVDCFVYYFLERCP